MDLLRRHVYVLIFITIEVAWLAWLQLRKGAPETEKAGLTERVYMLYHLPVLLPIALVRGGGKGAPGWLLQLLTPALYSTLTWALTRSY